MKSLEKSTGERMCEVVTQSDLMSYALLLSALKSESDVDADTNAMQRNAYPKNE